jgi:WD40 repeat protein/serine/threonine protein kinase
MAFDAARAKSLFLAASDLADAAERAAYLDRECGDEAELRARVEALLEADQAPARLRGAPGAAGTVDLPSEAAPTGTVGPEARPPISMATVAHDPERPTDTFGNARTRRVHSSAIALGTVIAGRYTLVEVIGEGGMGSVYLAAQTEPVKRQVALKLIKAGMDSKAVLARFDAERQALALMDHPNIARIYDGGLTPSGQPFFVMELVSGVPLTDYCDTHRQSVDARLHLFVSVCQAVQHAHQKGIIHRDLKPGNVLVTEVDGRPTPKVIDFGVARATEVPLTDQSFSDAGAIVGTPAYMSPEQADPTSMDIDTRTDVYALGVMLYELLAGSPPIDSKQFQRGAILEVLRMVREVDPPRPSTKLGTADALPNIAATRGIEPAKLANLLRGELDWVVMKALEKDRTRRYETANGLARDIQRYLADEVVEARPPSRGYRLKKFVKRNRGQVIAVGLVLVALVGGVVGTTIGLLAATAATRKERDANIASQAARTEAENAAEAERAAKIDAQRQQVRAEWLLYASQLALVQRELAADNVDAAAAVLKSTRRDFRNWEYDYLQTQFESNEIVCNALSIDAVSRDGRRLASSDYRLGKWGVTVWDTETGKLLASLKHSGPVRALVFNADGTRLVCGGEIANRLEKPADLKVWDLETGKVIFELEGHIPGIAGVCYSPDGTRITSLAGNMYGKSAEIKVWDALTGKEIHNLYGSAVEGGLGKGIVGGLAYSPDGKRIAAGVTQMLNVWDTDSGKVVLSFRAHQHAITSLAYSPDGKRIATTSPESNMKVWDAETGKELLGIPNGGGECVAFSRDGKWIAGPSGQLVNVWDAKTGKEVRSMKTGTLAGLAFTPDSRRLAIAAGGTVRTWEIDRRPGGLSFEAGKSGLGCMALSPDGQRIATGSALLDPTVKVWDTQTGKRVFSLKGHADFVSSLALSRDGKTLASASRDGTTRTWDMKTGDNMRTFQSGSRQGGVVALSPNGDRLATNEDDKTVTIWDLQSGKPTLTLPAATESVLSLAFSPDGTHLACGSSGVRDNLKVWNVQTGQLAFTRQEQNVFTVAFSPDGRYLAGAGIDRTIRVWDSNTGEECFVLRGHLDAIESVTFSPDGKRIATASADGTIRLWEARRGFEAITLPALGEPQRAVAFSADGRRLAGAGLHGTVRIWDVGLRQADKN